MDPWLMAIVCNWNDIIIRKNPGQFFSEKNLKSTIKKIRNAPYKMQSKCLFYQIKKNKKIVRPKK